MISHMKRFWIMKSSNPYYHSIRKLHNFQPPRRAKVQLGGIDCLVNYELWGGSLLSLLDGIREHERWTDWGGHHDGGLGILLLHNA